MAETLQAMRLFVKVAQLGSFSAAGREIGMSPASVFRHINALEHALKVQLIKRTTRSISLTDAGELYLHRVGQILQDIAETHDSLNDLQKAPRGLLNVQAPILSGTEHISLMVPLFNRRYPEIHVNLTLSDTPLPPERNIHLRIVSGRPTDSASHLMRKLISSSRVICASPSYLERQAEPTNLQELATHTCVTYRYDEAPPVWRFQHNEEMEEFHPPISIQTNNGIALREMVRNGLGIGVMPEWAAVKDFSRGTLKRLLPGYAVGAKDVELDHNLFVVYPRQFPRPRNSEIFTEFLVQFYHKLKSNDWVMPDTE